MFGNRMWQLVTVGLAAVILIFSLRGAFHGGRAQAQANATVSTTAAIAKALDYFYSDQNRYPTPAEFSNRSIMAMYLKGYPPQEFVTQECSQSFVYKQAAFNSYELDYCLPAVSGGFARGWNKRVGVK